MKLLSWKNVMQEMCSYPEKMYLQSFPNGWSRKVESGRKKRKLLFRSIFSLKPKIQTGSDLPGGAGAAAETRRNRTCHTLLGRVYGRRETGCHRWADEGDGRAGEMDRPSPEDRRDRDGSYRTEGDCQDGSRDPEEDFRVKEFQAVNRCLKH